MKQLSIKLSDSSNLCEACFPVNSSRRDFLKASLLSTLSATPQISGVPTAMSPIRVMIPKSYTPVCDPDFQYRLLRATLDYIANSYQGKKLPIWNKYFEQVDLEKRLIKIIYWICTEIETFKDIYPLDPIWLVAQIMVESFFCEFAISPALAVGICQFVIPTAHEYGMLCAGDSPEHFSAPYKLAEYAGQGEEYYRLRRDKRSFINAQKSEAMLTLEEAIQIIANGNCGEFIETARRQLDYEDRLTEMDKKIAEAKNNYRAYLEQNILTGEDDIDLFESTEFLVNFDERFTHKKPISSMVKMLTRHLRARNGNILAAAAGYNAGLSRTIDSEPYRPYGKIPSFLETADYLSHTLVYHHEITQRLYSQ
jgi:hypothetical protein